VLLGNKDQLKTSYVKAGTLLNIFLKSTQDFPEKF